MKRLLCSTLILLAGCSSDPSSGGSCFPEGATREGTIMGMCASCTGTYECRGGTWRQSDFECPGDGCSFDAGVDAGGPRTLFEDRFDDQPDFRAGDVLTLDGWSHQRVEGERFDARPAFEVSGESPDQVRGAGGKALVHWRESHSAGPGADGVLAATLARTEEIYARFWIRFAADYAPSGRTTIARIASWDETAGDVFDVGPEGANGPMIEWAIEEDAGGVRHVLELRYRPSTPNFRFDFAPPEGLPTELVDGALRLDFGGHVTDLDGDGEADNAAFRTPSGDDATAASSRAEVFGDDWTEVEIEARINTGARADGVLRVRIAGQVVFENTRMRWYDGGAPVPGWNLIAFGGPDTLTAHPDAEAYEEWLAIDDVAVLTARP